jgi:hypothetical protein
MNFKPKSFRSTTSKTADYESLPFPNCITWEKYGYAPEQNIFEMPKSM